MGAAKTSVRRRRAVPWLVLGLWIVVLAAVSPFASKLADVQHDRAVDYLPASADSTQVAKIQDRLPGGEATQMVVVYHRDGGLTAADRATAGRADRADRGRAHPHRRAAGHPVQGRDHRDVPRRQHRAGHGREGPRPPSSTTYGTSPRARTGSASTSAGKAPSPPTPREVYDSLGGPLLYTTAAVVALLLIVIYRSPVLWLVPLGVAGMSEFLATGRRLRAQPGVRDLRDRPERRHHDDPRVRRGHRLRPAPRLPLPRGTTAHRAAVRRHGGRAEGLRARRARLLRDRRRRAAVPARRRPQQQPRHGAARDGRACCARSPR